MAAPKINWVRWVGIGFAIGVAALTLAYGYGSLNNRVDAVEEDVGELSGIQTDIALIQKDIADINKKLDAGGGVVAVDGLADRSE